MNSIKKEYTNTPSLRVTMQYGGREVEIDSLSILLTKMARSQAWNFTGIMDIRNFYSKRVQVIAEERFRICVLDKTHNAVLLETNPVEFVMISKPVDDTYAVTWVSEPPRSIELTEQEKKIYKPKKNVKQH